MAFRATLLALTAVTMASSNEEGLRTEPAHVSMSQVGATPSHVYYVHIAVPFDLQTIEAQIGEVKHIIDDRHRVSARSQHLPVNDKVFHSDILPTALVADDEIAGHIQDFRLGQLKKRVNFLRTMLTSTEVLAGKKYAEDPFLHTEFHGPTHARVNTHGSPNLKRNKRFVIGPLIARHTPLKPLFDKTANAAATAANRTANVSTNALHQLISEALTPDDSNTSRAIQKRELFTAIIIGIGAGIAAFGIAATVSSSFQKEELAEISHATNDLNSAQRQAANTLLNVGAAQHDMARLINGLAKGHVNGYATIKLTNRIHIVVDELERRVETAESVLENAGRSKVSLKLLQQFDLHGSALYVAKEAEKRGLIPLAMHASDWLALQASFVETDTGFDVLLHVPIIKPRSLLAIYKNARVPIPAGDGLHMAIGGDRLQYIAVSTDRQAFKAFTEDDWQQCQQLGTFQLCDFGHTLRNVPHGLPRHKDEGLCLFYLLTRNFKAASIACDIFIGQQTEILQRTGPREFLSYTHDPIEARMDCEGNSNAFNHHLAFTLSGSQKITLPPNCWVTTPSHTFASADAGFLDRSHLSVTYAWPLPIEELTQGLNTSQFSQLIQESSQLMHRTNNSRMIPLTHAVRALHDVMTTSTHMWMASGILAGIVAILVFVVVCYCCRKKGFSRTRGTQSDTPLVQFNTVPTTETVPPSAPPARHMPPSVSLTPEAAAELANLVAMTPAPAAEFAPAQPANARLRGFAFPNQPPAPDSLPPHYAK